MKPTYNPALSYEQNYQNGPDFSGPIPETHKLNKTLNPQKFLGYTVNSTLGIPAGPLLNSAYINLYSQMGVDILTYKAVRSEYREAPPHPNICRVVTPTGWYKVNNQPPALFGLAIEEKNTEFISITNSFGMPSRAPQEWFLDVKRAKVCLRAGQVLVVSVVGTAKPGMEFKDLAEDFASTAFLAEVAGADVVEANLSCPNVQTEDGSIFKNPALVEQVAFAIKSRVKRVPLILKIGYLENPELVLNVVRAAYNGGASGIAAINTLPARIYTANGVPALPGHNRLVSGVCGAGIFEEGWQMAQRLLAARAELGLVAGQFSIIGLGGINGLATYLKYQKLGLDGIQIGTAAMWNPYLAEKIKSLDN